MFYFNFYAFRYGALDAKMASKSSFPSLGFLAVAGPTYDESKGQPPFQWSNTNIDGIPDFRPIDRFEFLPFNHTWAMNDASAIRFK